MAETSFVLDASVALAWGFESESNSYTEAVLEALVEGQAFVPGVWLLEVGNGLLVAERRGRLTHADVVQFLSLLQELPITVELECPERMLGEVLALAHEQGLSTYDASYLDLAMRLGLPLATQDQVLRQAASRCGVPLFAGEVSLE
ncbi:MAG: type II toxin-antitoxin system VapC family toxin [Thermoleophilia bacterium]|nr:type II toxin-antitoxin system VapC family toxin [Thermoleophilia bacterium]